MVNETAKSVHHPALQYGINRGLGTKRSSSFSSKECSSAQHQGQYHKTKWVSRAYICSTVALVIDGLSLLFNKAHEFNRKNHVSESVSSELQEDFEQCRVYKKGTEGLESVPYTAALFCAMLWLLYADDVVASGSIIWKVIRKKSVELLPHPIMLLVKVIAAIMWLLYGLALKDFYVTLPNAVRVLYGIVQMVLYVMYRKNKPVKEEKLPEHKGEVTNENKGEVINENKNVLHDQEKHQTVTIKMGDQKKKLDEEEEIRRKIFI
ncbi:hypothetical protein K1719_038588 [Acacia pycnantha]|nr:hypothetical protein K1719_038588 [Acacia pycnantha]